MSDESSKSLSDLPIELLLDHLLPALDVKDLLALSATCRSFAILCNDETFWKLKCKQDYNFSGSRTARKKGWRFIYRGLTDPKVFLWGANGNGRLGSRDVDVPSTSVRGGVPYPFQLEFPKKSAIVDLVAGGWSFHALDSWGNVFVWGAMDGDMFALTSDGFSEPAKIAETPLQLQLPEAIHSLSCGRKHSQAFDVKGQIWTFISWGRPFRLVTPALDGASPDSTPIQVESGWTFSVALTASGDVYAWWPFDQDIDASYQATMLAMQEQGDKKAYATADGKIPCETWDLIYNPERLPPINTLRLPNLFEKEDVSSSASSDVEPLKLIKIAAADNTIIGLTNGGHVLKLDGLHNPASARAAQWTYLPKFSETNEIRQHSAFATEQVPEDVEKTPLKSPQNVKINNITAHFRHFVAYTSEEESIVLRGSVETSAEDQPEIVPELQYKSILTVALGDYHNAALTSDGRLYTWGGYSSGALGLGDPAKLPIGAPGGVENERQLSGIRAGYRVNMRGVETPTEVRFDHGLKTKRDRFCFAVTAAGWHTGALVIDLEPGADDQETASVSDEEPTRGMPGHFDTSDSSRGASSSSSPPFIPMLGQRGAFPPFRVGRAGHFARNGPSRFIRGYRGRGSGGGGGEGSEGGPSGAGGAAS